MPSDTLTVSISFNELDSKQRIQHFEKFDPEMVHYKKKYNNITLIGDQKNVGKTRFIMQKLKRYTKYNFIGIITNNKNKKLYESDTNLNIYSYGGISSMESFVLDSLEQFKEDYEKWFENDREETIINETTKFSWNYAVLVIDGVIITNKIISSKILNEIMNNERSNILITQQFVYNIPFEIRNKFDTVVAFYETNTGNIKKLYDNYFNKWGSFEEFKIANNFLKRYKIGAWVINNNDRYIWYDDEYKDRMLENGIDRMLTYAVQNKCIETLEMCAKPELNISFDKKLLEYVNDDYLIFNILTSAKNNFMYSEYKLLIAAMYGFTEIFKKLVIDEKHDVIQTGEYKHYSLTLAVLNEHCGIVRWLLDNDYYNIDDLLKYPSEFPNHNNAISQLLFRKIGKGRLLKVLLEVPLDLQN